MADSEWRTRLAQAVAASPLSKRQISLDGGLTEARLAQALKKKTDVRMSTFLGICRGLRVSPVQILTGLEMDAEAEAILRWWQVATDREKASLRALAGL